MITKLMVLLFVSLQFKYSVIAIASCMPCICIRSYGAKKADCSKNVVNFTMNNIPNYIKSDIQILNMTQHNLVTLKNEAFIKVNLIELTSLYLDRCKIKIIEKEAFKELTYLTDLSLMYNDISVLEPGLFETNIFLKYLWIENNKIKNLPYGLFHKLNNFQGLFARFNEISYVDTNLFKNNEYLWIIDLSNNKLNYLNSQLIKHSNISIIFIQENPFICDCQLQNLHEIMKIRNLYNKTQPICKFPNKLRGKEMSGLNSSDFKCWLNTTIFPNQNIEIFDNFNLTIECISNALPSPETSLLHKNSILKPSDYYQEDTLHFYNFTITNLTAKDSGFYKCVSSNNIHNSTTQNIKVTIMKTEKPNIKMYQPSLMTFNWEIYNMTLSCQYSGIPKPHAQWKFNNTEIVPSPNYVFESSAKTINTYWLNLTIGTINYQTKGNYSCTAYNAQISVSATVQIKVTPPFIPQITIFGKQNIVEGANTTLSCFIQTYSKPSISWKMNNKSLNLNNYLIATKTYENQTYWNNLTIYNITSSDCGIYECAASTNEASSSFYHYLNVSIKYLNIKINYKRDDSDIKIWCVINGYPKPIIEWKYANDETNIISINNNTTKYYLTSSKISENKYRYNLTIYNITYNDNGIYYCIANNTKLNVTDYIILNFYLKSTYIYWYITVFLASIIIAIIFLIKIYQKCKNKINANTKKSNTYQTSDVKGITEIPMIEWSDYNEDSKSKEADIMYILDRNLTSYDLIDKK